MKKINIKNKILNNNRGFSMLELLISMAIIIFLVSTFLVDYRTGSRTTELVLASQKAVSDLRYVQNSTLGSARYNGLVPRGGWGVHFDKTAGNNKVYTVFADVSGNKNYDVVTDGGQKNLLPANVEISEILFNGVARNNIDILFLPPDPETIIWDGTNTTTVAIITFKNVISQATKNVTVNYFGMIEGQQ